MKEEITSLVDSVVTSKVLATKKEDFKFEPTAKMIIYLETAIRLGSLSPTTIGKACDVSFTNWSRAKWLGKEGFYDWFVSEWREKRRGIIPQLDAIGMQRAKKGDYAFWSAMNKKVGDLPDDNVPAGVSVQVNNLVEKQRDTYSLDE